MDFLFFALPQTPGLLPKWQFLVSSLALFNTVQNLVTLSLTRRIYSKTPQQVTPLQSRTFAIWTLTSAVVRLYCAYNIHNKALYNVTIWTYVIALSHFTSELVIYRSASLRAGLIAPLIVATTSLSWMIVQCNHYTV